VKDNPDVLLTEVQRNAEDLMQNHKLMSYRKIKSTFLKSVYHNLMGKSFETEEHIRRVRDFALKMGQRLALPKTELNRLAVLVLLHDIGKVKIIEDILTKKGMLNAEEWEKIKKHPEAGSRIARATEEFAHVADDILSHHEHWDGSGYPQGLKGDEIPLLARIMAIADAFEVMTSGRPYKKAMTAAAAAGELRRCAGRQFDPELVNLFLAALGPENKNKRNT
jgi:HD-GYP domain-containing protein (c-di-GMP phosphodiesterase class II)